ncbi:MAG: helix-turn-helix transcriptional regulator [Pseudomonadota bacterium]
MKTFQFSLIKKFREQAGMKQHVLAKRIGVVQQQLWTWENRPPDSTGSITAANLIKIAEALDRRTDEFFIES